MNYQYSWSAKISHLERYKGFFPSYADDQIDLSTDCSTGETSDRCIDFSKVYGQTNIDPFVGPVHQRKTKQSGKLCQEREEIGGSSNGCSGVSSGSGSSAHGNLNNGSRRRVRKAKTPRRSARKNDPRFRGVTFSVETKLCREKRQKSQLLIRSFYSMEKNRSNENHQGQTRNKRRNIPVLSTSTSGSDEPEATPVTVIAPQHIAVPYAGVGLGGKQCASCCTRRTPLWRDAEDGTPLCNACGIRYKKYHIRCVTCWNIPKKEGKTSCHVCSRCGNMLRITVPKRSCLC